MCFSGGFADVIYEGCDPGKGLAKANRCGFFATVSDRVAAGCTSDVDEENYREYYGGMVEDIKAWLAGEPVRRIA